ncbi:heme ABC exporter ATP-binding protein CcmA [Pelagerythrobacter rhizovicinus]|uniref:Heme ABC exporter ATP-binding protein CcmA n=1 Tax=Pelagerythrobacter rhizovicinus TaxID=2268576 RepID=A0A4Q2KIN7_9SPHN|nr:heme ABC exporter ATP-binding protein CcmA [Pelagerythrobacter rhizovicinus]RXZ64050.1 heme ABC exporter ATP-binding protein CcmA [Pelagerythrobacter rhizovicinus]
MQAMLAARDLACRRGERLLFRGLSLALSRGEACHVAGPNGIGKTSLIRILAGLLRPFHGSVECRASIGLLDERHALDPQVPLDRALAFWSELDGSGASLMAAHRERLGLADLADVPVRYLSTGQRKRAALARLLGQRAPVWLLDEPLNGLDTAGTELVETLIAEHRAAGGACVVASHQPIRLTEGTRLEITDFAA